MQATPIQAKVIPILLEGKDVIGGAAQTETASTAIFRSGKGLRVKSADDARIALRGIFFDFFALIDKKVATLFKYTIK